jgi:hypothetical protein
MVKVKWEDYDSCLHERECVDLWEAMALSKHLKDKANIVADIVDKEIVYVGAMGANVVVDGQLPDGDEYEWYKRRPDPKK